MSGQLIGPEHRQTSTGTALLEEIAAQRIAWSQTASGQEQKEALAMLKKLRIQSVTEPEITLPQHWSWATLLHVAKVIIDCDHKTPVYATDGIHLIRTTDIRNGSMHLHSTKKVSQEGYLARSKRLTPEYGDIFFTREAPMGEAAIVPAGEQVCLGQRLMLIRLFEKYASNRFLLYAIQSPSFQRRMQAAAVGMTVKHINVGDVENLFVPMPPRLEQDQIVSTIDALFTLCDQYAGQLSQKLGVASRMGSTVINNFTGITTTKSEEPMKAPQTELIAPLRLGQAPDIKAQAPLASILARHQGQMLAKDLWQRFGGEIDAFYAQLKTEVAHGWILEPAVAEVREVPVATAGA
jgi:type I restriction enzyme S subunit